jgi:hypothetical protein
MSKPKYTIKIETPCEQDWSSMINTDSGKHCSNCAKTVIDFTQLSDSEVFKFIEQYSGKLCGRFTQEQLNRDIQLSQPTNNSRLYKILAGLLLLGASENLLAADNQKMQADIVSNIDNSTNSPVKETKSEPTTDSLKNVVRGLAIDSATKEPLRYVSILIKNTLTRTSTDLDGKFELEIPDSLVVDEISLIITYVGYNADEIVINKNDLPITDKIINMTESKFQPLSVFGNMELIEIIEKKKWWQRKKKSCH